MRQSKMRNEQNDKRSVGRSDTNNGTTVQINESKFVLDRTRKYALIDVVPMGAVRMTKSDTWKTNPNHPDPDKRQRPAVTRYFEYKNKVVSECNKIGYQLKGHIEVVFCMPMPDSWSEKKKDRMNGLPHKSRPDLDNMVKALMDTLREEDGDVWSIKMEKRHSQRGAIILFE